MHSPSSHQDGAAPRAARVTINDLAEALGLSKGTISRALNNYPDISDRTRNRVARAAERLGYSPLSHAQAIKTGRTRALGLVVQLGDHDGQRPFLADFLSGISEAASAEGWTLTVATSETGEDTLRRMHTLIEERKADGFILPRTEWADPRVALLKAEEIPFVLFGRTGTPEGCAWYDILGEEAMRAAVLRLAALGHRRIGYVGGRPEYTYSRLRAEGIRAGLAEAGLAADPALLCETAVRQEGGARAARAYLDLPEPPTAIVCAVDHAALGVCAEVRARGLEPGRDLSVIGYDGVPEGAWATPPLATFAVDNRRAGSRLARLLIRRIRGDAPEDLRETDRATFMERASMGPPRGIPAAPDRETAVPAADR